MKKLLTIGGVIVAVFALILVLNNLSNKEKLKDNPYGDKKLDQATIDLIGDEHYKNITLPEELKTQIEAGESVTAYFFSPLCSYCREMTPVMMPIADEMGVDVKQFNTLEFGQEAIVYDVQATPTMIHFENGEEIGRMIGGQSEENIRLFFNAVQDEEFREEYWQDEAE